MNKILLLLGLSFVTITYAANPIDLVKKDACRWAASSVGKGDDKKIVINKGCPD